MQSHPTSTVLLFSGKGGVGKTSLSAATALGLARAGQRTLVVSTDPAHSLGDVFGTTIGASITALGENLWGKELRAREALEGSWDKIATYIQTFLASQGVNSLIAAEIANVPGIMELLSLLEIVRQAPSYDTVILDCAPTGATTSLLAFPDAARWYMDRFFRAERALIKAVKPLAERVVGVPLPEDDVFGQAEALYHDIRAANDILQDPRRSRIRLVATPDAVVLAETRRAHAMFSLYNLTVDAVFLNRAYPADSAAAHPLLGRWVTAQQQHTAQAVTDFAPIPVITIPFQSAEPQGPAALAALTDSLGDFGRLSRPHEHETAQRITPTPDGYELRLRLPVEDRKAVRLWVDAGDLVFMYHAVNKRVALPAALAECRLDRADWQNPWFCVKFVRK